MQTQWFELALVIVGGIIGIASGILVTIVGNKFEMKRAQRNDLLAAYADWFRALYRALDEVQRLWIYDAVEKMVVSLLRAVSISKGGKSTVL